jgi:hypothetical protein
MNEDDTFNALRRLPFHNLRKIILGAHAEWIMTAQW